MAVLPHDSPDLYLAPLVLALDAQIEKLSRLDVDQLARQVALEANTAGWTREQRESGLLWTICHTIDCHDWEPAWDSRGVRLTHDQHRLVLGVPATFAQYVSGSYAGAVREAADLGSATTLSRLRKPRPRFTSGAYVRARSRTRREGKRPSRHNRDTAESTGSDLSGTDRRGR